MSEPQIEEFRRLWSEYDPEATGLIEVFELKDLIDDLREDEAGLLKYGKFLDSDKQIDLFIAELEIPTYNNFRNYHFLDVLNSIARYNVSLKHHMAAEETSDLKTFEDELEEIEAKGNKKIAILDTLTKQQMRLGKRLRGSVDRNEGIIYSSAHIVWVPIIQHHIRMFLRKVRERMRKERGSEDDQAEDRRNSGRASFEKSRSSSRPTSDLFISSHAPHDKHTWKKQFAERALMSNSEASAIEKRSASRSLSSGFKLGASSVDKSEKSLAQYLACSHTTFGEDIMNELQNASIIMRADSVIADESSVPQPRPST